MHINVNQLEAFVATVEKGSFSGASRHLKKAQSAVSTAVMNLEIDLGLTLFDRSRKYPLLTPEGKGLLRDARQLLAMSRNLMNKAEGISRGIEPSLTLALDEIAHWDVMAGLLDAFAKAFPQVELEFLTASLDDAGMMVESGRADIGVVVPLAMPPLAKNMRIVGTTKFLPAVGVLHPLAGLATVTMADLPSHRQLLATSRGGNREGSEYVVGSQAWWVENPYIARDMIASGLGWGFLPEFLLREGVREGSLKQLPLDAINSEILAPVILSWTLIRPLGPAGNFLIQGLGNLQGQRA